MYNPISYQKRVTYPQQITQNLAVANQ